MVLSSTDTAFAIPEYNDKREYKIKGLKQGKYSILFDGINPYKDTTF
jgi:hypothetical protein